jgi:hypothetical protein
MSFAIINTDGALGKVEGGPGEIAHFAYAEAAPQHQQKHGAVPQGIDDPKQGDDLVFCHRAGEVLGHEDVMAWVPNGGLRDIGLVAQEVEEPLHHAEAGRDAAWCELVAERGLDPGINIGGRGLCQVCIQGGLACCGHEDRETFEGAEGGFLHCGGIVAGTQVGQIVGHQALVPGTEEAQPAQLWEFLERWGGL